MQPIYLTVGLHPLMIIPDRARHAKGAAESTHTYYVYRHQPGSNDNEKGDYIGRLVFEIPDKLFDYFPEGPHPLESGEASELVEHLSHYRESSG